MLKRCTAALAASLIALAVSGAYAQTVQPWPTRPVTMIVPFAAGGPTDVVGRILAQRLGEILGQQVIIENLGGAGGMAGAQKIAQSRPDGYQILLGTVGTQAYSQTLYKTPLYNSLTDFTPVALVAEQPLVLVRESLELALHRLELAPQGLDLLLLGWRVVRERGAAEGHQRAQHRHAH